MERNKDNDDPLKDRVGLVENEVQNRWSSSDEEEALRLIDLMISTPSKIWFDMIFKAEQRKIKHWKLLLQYKERLSSAAAEAVADEDGQVIAK
jgi:hypothetical protein